VQWVIVILIGTTVTFIIPRFSPVNPVDVVMASLASYQTTDPQAMLKLKESLEDMMGLNENIFVQYFKFWGRLLKGDLGPSLARFPIPVIRVIGNAMPWTISLLLIATILGWLLGMVLGTFAAYYSHKSWSKILQVVIMALYPVPYYVMALILLMIFAYIFPIFPLFGGVGIGLKPSLSLNFILSVIKHGFLPAVSIILVSIGWRFMSQRALTSTLLSSDFIVYARIAGVRNRKILFYLFRNSLLPQATDLALSLGGIFSGALITEVVFSYPGLGQILYSAILQGDYNLVIGISVFSIIGVATGALIIDLLYPFLDPRIRYS
jgi:peptide/nickel transport system permease protein